MKPYSLSNFAIITQLTGMKIIDRYIIREIIKPMIVVCLVLVSIFAGYSATRYLADATSGLLSAKTVFSLILLKIIIALEVLLPTTIYLSVVVGLGRLYTDLEMTAFEACGVKRGRIYRNVLSLAVLVGLVVAGLSLFIRPWAYRTAYQLKNFSKNHFRIKRMEPATFYELESGKRIIFAQQVDKRQQRAQQVFIYTKAEDKLQIIAAKEVSQQSERFYDNDTLVFRDGTMYDLSASDQRETVAEFQQYALALSPPAVLPLTKIKAAATAGLMQSDTAPAIAELQWRFSTPITTMLLALLGIPLSRTSPRRGKYAKVVLAVVIYAVFYTLSLVIKTWVGERVINPWPGIWGIEGIMALLLLIASISFFQEWHLPKKG